LTIHKNVICTFCGCCCDDIEVTVENNRIVAAKYACAIAATKFLNCQKERNPDPLMRKNGDLAKVELEEALNRAAEILAKANYPILYGWSSTSCEAIKVGIELAEEVGGAIDNTSVVCHGPTLEAVQDVGESSCTLGEVRHRADLIVYWGCNPANAHIRHMIRYSALSKGRYRDDRKKRKIVVVDVRKTVTSRMADEFIQIEPGKDYEFMNALRMAVNDMELEVDKVAGVASEKIEELAELLVSCEFGTIFFGLGLTESSGRNENISAALSLVRDLNSKTKFLIMPMRGHFNVTGANKVTAWQTGYPFAVDFSHGYPRYNPGETSAIDLLARGECDAAFIIASDPAAHFPQPSVKTLSQIPVIVVDPSISATGLFADVIIPSAFVGIECEGTIYRMDGIPLLTKKLVEPPSNCMPDAEILKRILNKVRKLKGVA
jgi:formylmethanofuran dehydrogenase subunit B